MSCTFFGCSTTPDVEHSLSARIIERRQQKDLTTLGGKAGEQGKRHLTTPSFFGKEVKFDNEANPCVLWFSNFWLSPKMAKQNLRVKSTALLCSCLHRPYLTTGLEFNTSYGWMNEEINEASKLRLFIRNRWRGPESHRGVGRHMYSPA